MDLRGIPANLLSLGAIDFGIIVDGAVIMTENILRHLAEHKPRGHRVVREVQQAAVQVARPLTFAVLIIMTVYVPILTFQRIEGKLFRPMAVTISLAVIGALVLTLTLIPVLMSLLFRRPPSERESPLLRWLRRPYLPGLRWCLRRPVIPVLGALACVALSLFLFTRLGKEFLPELDEGDLWVRVQFPVGISLQAVRPHVREIRERLLGFPEVRVVVSQLAAPDDGTDPEGLDNLEFYVGLKRRDEWQTKDKAKLVAAMTESLASVPGITTNFSQPIKDNVDEALAGVKGELAIKLYGPDIFVMDALAKEITAVLKTVRGVADLDYDHLIGQPELQIVIDRAAAARYGINVQDVQDVLEAATKGRVVTEIFERERRFNLAVRLVPPDGDPIAGLRNVTVSAPSGERIPLPQLAEFSLTDGISEILREGNIRRLAVKWSVRERDMGGLVAEAMPKVEAVVRLPEGYRMVWSGRFEDQQRALARLYIIIPLVIFIIFILLFAAFDSVGDALLIMLNLPFALIGGTVALYLWGANFNISAAVGYVAVFGVSVLHGVVLVSSIPQAHADGLRAREAATERAPELGPLPAGLGQASPLVVEVRAREEDRDHLLGAPVPEPEAPGRWRAGAALGREESAARDTAEPRELGARRPAMVADAEVEVPRPGVDRHVTVEHRHLRRHREADLVRGALGERADGDRGPVLGEELGQETLDAVALDVQLVVSGDGPVELAHDHGESIRSLEREHHRQTDAQRPGRHGAGQGLRDQTPDRLHRGVVQDGVGGGIGDRDGADHPVGPDDDLDVDRAAEPAPTRGERVAQRLLDACAKPPEIGGVLRSRAARATSAACDGERKSVTDVGRAAGSAPQPARSSEDTAGGHPPSRGAG